MSERARQAARRLLEESQQRPPVDVEAIAAAHGVTIRSQALEENVSGVLVIKDGRAVIGVNEAHHPNRQRFSIAHELGHFLLHGDAARVFVDASPVFYRDAASSEGTRLQEVEANTFAAELLMPEEALRELVGDRLIDASDEASIRKMAGQLGVSVQAMAIRLTRLGLLTA